MAPLDELAVTSAGDAPAQGGARRQRPVADRGHPAGAPANDGIPTFDDTNPMAYWSSANPQGSVKVAGHGVTATVTANSGGVLTVSVVNPAASG